METDQKTARHVGIRDELLSFFARLVQERMQAEGAAVILHDESEEESFIPVAVFEDAQTGQRFQNIRFPEAKGVSGRVRQTGQPLVVEHYPQSPYAWPRMDEQTDFHTRNMIAVPMRVGPRVVGVLCAVNKKSGAAFAQDDLDLLEDLAGVAVLPIQNAFMQADLEAALQRVSEFNKAKDSVIQHLSHELKTPLAILGASLKLLKKKLPQTPDRSWETIYDRAQRGLERLTDMEYEIEDILRHREDHALGKLSRMLDAAAEPLPVPDDKRNSGDPPEKFFREVNIEFLIHELKDPLSIIETNAGLLMEKHDPQHYLTARQSSALDRMVRNIRKARAMLWQLLEVGRADAQSFNCLIFKPEIVLREILKEVVESNAADLYGQIKSLPTEGAMFDFLARNGIRLEISSSAEGLEIYHDETKFRQIGANLLKNAIDYRRRMLLLHVSVQQAHLTVAIRDDGPGIAPEHQEAIFKRYQQITPQPGLARSGHGLGLAVSRILARSMGGDIVLESQLGQGALFKLRLPLAFAPVSVSD